MDNDDIKRQERRQQQRHQRFLQHQQWPPSPTAPPEQPAPGDYHKLVYFTVGQRHEAAKFTCDTPAYQLKELFRSAAEAGPHDILKLYDSEGHLMNISGELASNTADERYTLEVVSAHTTGMLADEFGVDLAALESRVAQLEAQLRAECDVLPPALQELRQQVDGFKHKLETTEHLSWLGFYKNLPEPISSEECKRLQYRRKSDSIRKRVKERFFQICDGEVSERVRLWIRMPTFDSRQWEDEEVLLILQQMFLDLDLCAKLGIDLNIFRNFLFEVYKNYNEVPFHNFRHCFCVAQMMYAIIWAADLQSKLGDLEILILLVSCICHDLDHPGFNNIYQINAKTELALRYNDISPLENHHCSVAFRILEMDDCNIFKGFSMETFKQVREGMIRCILATDMARHNEILAQFKEITPDFDYSNKAHTNLLTMVLIKVADISNEARPMDIAEPWLDRLLQEFFKQSDAEKLEGLPITPFMDREKITKPSSQCSFIGFVLLPLFEALGDLLTELQDLIIQPVRDALDYYRRLNEATKEERLHRKSVVGELLNHPVWAYSHPTCPRSPDDSSSTSTGTNVTISVSKSGSAQSVKSRKSISFQQNRSRSRSIEEDMQPTIENLEESAEENSSLNDLLEDNESGDSETATEVEVSEKTLKFKISTEGSIGNSGRKSYPGSRKGSREKGQQSACSELAAKAVQWEKDKGKLSSLTVSFERPSTKKFSLDMTSESLEGFRKFHGRSLDISKFGGFGSPTSGKSIDFAEDDENKDSEEEKSYKNVNELSVQESGTVRDRKSILKSPNTGVGADETEKCTVDNLVNNKYDSSKHINVVSFEDVTKPDKTEPKTDGLSQSQTSGANNRTFVIDNSVKCINTKPDEILVEKYDLKNVPVSESVLQEKSVEPKISPNNNHRSFLSRIRQFTDRFGLSFDKETTKLKNSKVSGGSFKNNNGSKVTVLPKTKCKKIDSHCCRSVEDEYTDIKKASTLPKMKKPNQPESKKGWKYLITGSGSSLEVLPPSLPPKDIESDNQLSPSSSKTKSSLVLYPKLQNNVDTKIDCHLFDQSGAGQVKVDDTSPPKEVDKPINI